MDIRNTHGFSNTVEALRERGVRVWVDYIQNDDGRRGVMVALYSADENYRNAPVSYAGYSFCSKKDHFCKRIGRDIALGRALKCYYAWGGEYK